MAVFGEYKYFNTLFPRTMFKCFTHACSSSRSYYKSTTHFELTYEYCMKNAAEIENMQKMYVYSPDMRHTKFLFIYTLFIHIKCLKKNFYLRMFLIKKFLLFKVSLTVPDVSSFGRERFGNRIFHKTLWLTDI